MSWLFLTPPCPHAAYFNRLADLKLHATTAMTTVNFVIEAI
jgi:hypothetical protein